MSKLDERVVGELVMFFFLETIFSCYLFGIDPFTQPAVEEGKKITREFLKNE